MESEKVKEIKKALEHCGDKITCQSCPEYNNEPIIDWFECKKNLLQKTITLINELESENERLSKALVDNLEAYKDGFNEGAGLKNVVDNKLKTENQELKDRIAELEKENESLKKQLIAIDTLDETNFEKRHNAIVFITEKQLKQFAERLKERYVDENLLIDGYFRVIDELLKEYGK